MRNIATWIMFAWLCAMLYVFTHHQSGQLKDEEFRIVAVLTCCLGISVVFAWFDPSMKDKSDR